MNKKSRSGFTLVELLIILVIVLLVAVVVVMTVLGRMREAKAMEARDNLTKIANDAQSYFHGIHPLGDSGETFSHLYPGCEPIGANAEPQPCEGVSLYKAAMPVGEMIQPSDPNVDAQSAPWPRLRFLPTTPFYYNIIYTSNVTPGNTSFHCLAVGSLSAHEDSVFEIMGVVSEVTNGPKISEIEDKSAK